MITEKNSSKKLLKRLLKESKEFEEIKIEKQKVDEGKDDLLREVEMLRQSLRAKDAKVAEAERERAILESDLDTVRFERKSILTERDSIRKEAQQHRSELQEFKHKAQMSASELEKEKEARERIQQNIDVHCFVRFIFCHELKLLTPH